MFKEIGGNEYIARVLTTANGFLNILAVLVAGPLIDKFGRKTLMIYGVTALAINLIAIGFLYAFVPSLSILSTVLIFAYSIAN